MKQKHTHALTRGKLDHPDGDGGTVRLEAGATLTPTPTELREFGDVLRPLRPRPAPPPPEDEGGAPDGPDEELVRQVSGMTAEQALKAVEAGHLDPERARVAELAGKKRKTVLRGIAARQAGRGRKRVG